MPGALCIRFYEFERATYRSVLEQGLELPTPPLAAAERLPEPRQLLRALPTYDRPEHVYRLPPNTAGTATLGRRRPAAALGAPPVAAPGAPPVALGAPPVAAPGAPPPGAPPAALGAPPPAAPGAPPAALGAPPPAAPPAVAKSLAEKQRDRSAAYRLKRAGCHATTRAYDRKRARNVCRTCGEVQSVETGHSKYKGYLYCERNAAGESLAVWRARVEREHAAKKAAAAAAAAMAAAVAAAVARQRQ